MCLVMRYIPLCHSEAKLLHCRHGFVHSFPHNMFSFLSLKERTVCLYFETMNCQYACLTVVCALFQLSIFAFGILRNSCLRDYENKQIIKYGFRGVRGQYLIKCCN